MPIKQPQRTPVPQVQGGAAGAASDADSEGEARPGPGWKRPGAGARPDPDSGNKPSNLLKVLGRRVLAVMTHSRF